MGMVYVTVGVAAPVSDEYTPLECLVDSGAMYSVLPPAVWRRLGLRPSRSLDFRLADGSLITRRVGEARFRLEGVEATTPVILGARHDDAILGALTLENMGLVLNPFERTIRPFRVLPLKSLRHECPPTKRPGFTSSATALRVARAVSPAHATSASSDA